MNFWVSTTQLKGPYLHQLFLPQFLIGKMNVTYDGSVLYAKDWKLAEEQCNTTDHRDMSGNYW